MRAGARLSCSICGALGFSKRTHPDHHLMLAEIAAIEDAALSKLSRAGRLTGRGVVVR